MLSKGSSVINFDKAYLMKCRQKPICSTITKEWRLQPEILFKSVLVKTKIYVKKVHICQFWDVYFPMSHILYIFCWEEYNEIRWYFQFWWKTSFLCICLVNEFLSTFHKICLVIYASEGSNLIFFHKRNTEFEMWIQYIIQVL